MQYVIHDDPQQLGEDAMSIPTPYSYHFITSHRLVRSWVRSCSIVLVAVGLLGGCNGSNDDDTSSELRDETVTGSTLELTLPSGFDPDDIETMQLAVSGGSPLQRAELFDLEVGEVTLGDRNILAFALKDTISPGIQRQFTLLAFPSTDTVLPNLIAQETTDVQENTDTKVVMKLFEADSQLAIAPANSENASTERQLAIVPTEPQLTIVPRSIFTSCVGQVNRLKLSAMFTAKNCPTDDLACGKIMFTVDDIFVGPKDNRRLQSLASLALWRDRNNIISIAQEEIIAIIAGESPGTSQITATVESLEATADFTITNNAQDCAPPEPPSVFVSIAEVAVPEGDGGARDIILTARLSAPPETGDISIDFTTADSEQAEHRATANDDYLTTKGTLTFRKGETEKQLPITIRGDRDLEPDEQFGVVLSNPQPPDVQLLFSEVGVTLLNDDSAVFAKGVGLRNFDQNTGEIINSGEITLNIPEESATNALRAFLTWQPGGQENMDETIRVNNNVIQGEPASDRSQKCLFADITEIIVPGLTTYTVSFNNNQEYIGAGIAVVTHVLEEVATGMPQNNRMGTVARLKVGSASVPLGTVEVQAGCDAFHHNSDGNENSKVATFLFESNTEGQARNVERQVSIIAFVGDAQSRNTLRGSELLFLSDSGDPPVDLVSACQSRICVGLGGPRELVRVLDAIDGPFWDTFGRNSGVPSTAPNDPDLRGIFIVPLEAEFASFQLVSPADDNGVSATLSMVVFKVSEE